MKIHTRIFGEIEIAEEKIITFENGIIGFPDLKRFTLLHDEARGTDAGIRFLQSIEEPGFAMPVMDPLIVKPDYNPEVNDELLAAAGEITPENLVVLVTVTIPKDLTKMTVNLQGPFVINAEERKACQVIVEGQDYPVKFPVYEISEAEHEIIFSAIFVFSHLNKFFQGAPVISAYALRNIGVLNVGYCKYLAKPLFIWLRALRDCNRKK